MDSILKIADLFNNQPGSNLRVALAVSVIKSGRQTNLFASTAYGLEKSFTKLGSDDRREVLEVWDDMSQLQCAMRLRDDLERELRPVIGHSLWDQLLLSTWVLKLIKRGYLLAAKSDEISGALARVTWVPVMEPQVMLVIDTTTSADDAVYLTWSRQGHME